MTEDATQQPTVQKDRKAHESFNVQRLTTWVGAAALSLSGIFTAFAAKGAPMTIGVAMAASVQPGAAVQNQVRGALDDRIVVRRVYVPPPRPAAGGVREARPAAGQAPGQARPVSTVVSAAPAAAPPKPVAATGGSTPRH